MFKKGLFVIFLLSTALYSYSQQKVVAFTASVTYPCGSMPMLIIKARVDQGWHLYSQKADPNAFRSLNFKWKVPENATIIGPTKEPPSKVFYDSIMRAQSGYFEQNQILFHQQISVSKANKPFTVSVTINGQACQDNGQCIPIFDEVVKFKIDPSKSRATEDCNQNNNTKKDTDGDGIPDDEDDCPAAAGIAKYDGCADTDNDGIPDNKDECPSAKGLTAYNGCADTDLDSIPDNLDDCPKVAGNSADGCPIQDAGASISGPGRTIIPQRLSNEVLAALEQANCGEVTLNAAAPTPWYLFIKGLLWGFAALLTPCVFPIIPLTVSFFTKQSKTRSQGIINGIIYALSIIFIYTALGFIIPQVFGISALNGMASSAFWNILFFLVFFIFALSFLGAFELTLPSKFVNFVNKGSNKRGLLGIFFMAFTLSLVSFSCTGPIIGTVLIDAVTSGNKLGPLMGMFGFSLALAIPFAFFAAFPAWMSSLPKSGGWLNTVKVSLGFIELALAMKFLSTVDLVYHWGILQREVFLAIWIAIFGAFALYLLGVFKLKGDGEKKHISLGRLLFSLLIISFTIYLIPGMWGAPVKLLSGLAPPSFYKEWSKPGESHKTCPHGINCYHDFQKGMAAAAKQQKPVMIDFTGWSCVNCRKMEDNVWSDPKILSKLKNDYILISLYVDDRTVLPTEAWTKSLRTGEILKTVGAKWNDFQQYYYDQASQPQYVLIDPLGKLLAKPTNYEPDIDEYNQFLISGLCRFKLRKKQGNYQAIFQVVK